MRHKQRPTKSSRHKSVTCIIDSHTSFGDNSGTTGHHQSSPAVKFQHLKSAPHLSSQQHQPPSHLPQPTPSTSHKSQRTTSYQHGDANVSNRQHGSHQTISLFPPNSNRSLIKVDDIDEQALMRKQFEHNYRHMSDVMRLAFLENNDISIDDCSNVDFNSLSTASILQRNIQQQLLQERRDQMRQQQLLRQRQQQHQQQQHQQQQHRQHQQQHQFQNNHRQHNQLDSFNQSQDLQDDFDDELYEVEDDYDLSDSRIFATTTPGSTRNSVSISVARGRQQPGSSGSQRQQLGASGGNPATGVGNKRRQDEAVSRIAYVGTAQPEVKPQNYGEGFLCDEPGCGKSFPSLRKLRHHKVVHSDEFPFVCEFHGCAKKFKRKFGIDLHSTTHFDLDPAMYSKTSNNSSLPFFGRRMQYSMCKPCGQKFKTVHEYQYHMLKHGKEPFKCPVKGCGQTFGIWKSFQKHRASHYFNYYCKMDPSCEHHTSNLQLLKLHIYCCHFRRKLPENATLMSRDPAEDEASREDPVDVLDTVDDDVTDPLEVDDTPAESIDEPQQRLQPKPQRREQDSTSTADSSQRSLLSTPRRDARLRRSPPRSSTFGQQDYAAVNNGSSFAKSLASTPTKRTRSAANLQQVESQSTPQTEKKVKLPLKVLPKRSAQKSSKEPVDDIDDQEDHEQEVKVQNYGDGFLCDEPGCGKSFLSLRKLRHHKVVHSDEFPFVCEFHGCAKKFKRKFGIDLHSTTHFDLDPAMYSKTSNNSSLPFFGRRMQYSMCKPCGQKFKTVHEYQYHMLKHGKEPFKCPVKGCGQTFGIWKSFQKHRASHYFNYYCKMDPSCEHHTSNLQLLKLHIYCCHFRRKLPENATLMSRDRAEDDADQDDPIDVMDTTEDKVVDQSVVKQERAEDDQDMSSQNHSQSLSKEQDSASAADSSQRSLLATPRRDSRLRKNPPRSSTFGQQDYASVNNGSSYAKSLASTPSKRTRSSAASSQHAASRSAPPAEKKSKPPLKVLPKRGAQRLPMSLIAGDASTEDEEDLEVDEKRACNDTVREGGSDGGSTQNDDEDEDDDDDDDDGDGDFDEDGEDGRAASRDPSKRNKFKCHLCDYKFSVRFQLTKHLSTHLELTPEMYSKTADKQVVALSEQRRRECYCDKCNLGFEQMADLDEHMQTKHGPRPYVCHFCQVPSSFSIAKQYLSHLYEHRFNYRCTMTAECEFTINRKDALKLHIFRMHLNQKLPSYIENFANMIDPMAD